MPGVFLVRRAGFFGQGSVANAMGGARIVGPTGRDQAYVPRGEPTFRKGGGAKGGGKGGFDTGAGVGGKFLPEVMGGAVGEVGKGAGTGQVPSGPPPSHKDQAVSALQALIGLLEPAIGALPLPPPRMLRLWRDCTSFVILRLS